MAGWLGASGATDRQGAGEERDATEVVSWGHHSNKRGWDSERQGM